MSDTVKSIFRQKEIEKLYELKYCGTYYISIHREPDVNLVSVSNTENVISDKVIGTYDIEIPMLEVDDEFFLHDIQEVVKVKSKMRSSDGSITYYVEDEAVICLTLCKLKRYSFRSFTVSWSKTSIGKSFNFVSSNNGFVSII